jgi:hypothetical protein
MPAVNSKILQADYNDIRNKMVSILGSGSGNFGWGQQARINSSAVAEGNKVTINEWANLRYDVINAYKHINGSNPTTAQVAEGNTIRYTSNFTPDTGALDVPQKQYDDWANNITNNRFTVAAGESVVTAAISQTKTTAWNGTVSCVIGFYFGSANEARYFFNSGGQIRISASRIGGTVSAQNTAWTNLLTAVGTQIFGANTPGTGTTPSDGLNWYRCTSTFQTYYTGTASSPYGSNNIQLQARVTDVTNNSTGTAAYGEIRVVFTDGYTDPVVGIPPSRAFGPDPVPPNDLVDGTLTVSCNLRYATGIMVPTSAVFTVTQPTLGIGAISSDYTPPAGLATYSPSIFFDSLVFDLNNYLTEYYYPIQDTPGSLNGQYKLDGRGPGSSGEFDQHIFRGGGGSSQPNNLFTSLGGNWTIPANDSDFFAQYVNTFDGSGPTPGPSIRYQVAKTTTVYDGDFYVKTFGYGDQNIPATERNPGVYVLNDDPAPDPTEPIYYDAGNYPTSRPLTAFGYRPGSNRTVGWGKTGRFSGNPSNTLGFIYENATVNGFQVYAWRRCVYGATYSVGYGFSLQAPAVCDLYLLIGHPRWNSVFGTVTFASSDGTAQQSSQLKMSGSTNVLAVTMLLCKQEGLGGVSSDIPVANLQTIVQNLTNRMKLFFYF